MAPVLFLCGSSSGNDAHFASESVLCIKSSMAADYEPLPLESTILGLGQLPVYRKIGADAPNAFYWEQRYWLAFWKIGNQIAFGLLLNIKNQAYSRLAKNLMRNAMALSLSWDSATYSGLSVNVGFAMDCQTLSCCYMQPAVPLSVKHQFGPWSFTPPSPAKAESLANSLPHGPPPRIFETGSDPHTHTIYS